MGFTPSTERNIEPYLLGKEYFVSRGLMSKFEVPSSDSIITLSNCLSLRSSVKGYVKAFYNYKPCCDKKINTVGSLILGETESPNRAKHNIDQRHLL